MQKELDVQVEVTQSFDTTRQGIKTELNKAIDSQKAIVVNKTGESTPIAIDEANQQIGDTLQKVGVLVDMISGGLSVPTTGVGGTIGASLSPALSYEIGQYFKEEGKEGSAQHILAHAILGAISARAAGNDALNAAIGAGE